MPFRSGSFSSFSLGSVDARPGADGTIAVPDAQLLFNAEFKKLGDDLLLLGDDGKSFLVQDYFKGDKLATLMAPSGATLAGRLVGALTGGEQHVQEAQAGAAAATAPIGRIEKVTGTATIVRNGVAIAANQGDVVLKGDVLQTAAGSTLGVAFIDGTVFSLSASARLAVNELVYDPNGTSNSAFMSIIQGSVTFVAGQVAKTGDMKVGTPVATMGIRGTAVFANVDAVNGDVKISLLVERGGELGRLRLDDNAGNLLSELTDANVGIVVRGSGPGQVQVSQVALSPLEQQQALQLLSLAYQTLDQFNQGPQLAPREGNAPGAGSQGSGTPGNSGLNQNAIPEINAPPPPVNNNRAPGTQTNLQDAEFEAEVTTVSFANAAVEGGKVVGGSVNSHTPGSPRVYALVGAPPPGLQFNPDGSYSFDPTVPAYDHLAQDAVLQVLVNYVATQNGIVVERGTLNFVVTGTNDAPAASATTLVVAEKGALVAGHLIAVDPDDGAQLIFSLIDPAPPGLIVNADGSFTFDPSDPAYRHLGVGEQEKLTVTYLVSDGLGGTDTAELIIIVNGTNEAPTAVNDSYTTAEDTPLNIAAPGVLANDGDSDGDLLAALLVAGPQHGTLTLNPDGSFTYTPDANYNGPDAFTYKVNDGNGGTDTATVDITVTAENDPPVGVNDSYTTAEDTPLNIAAPGVLANDGDVDGDLLAALLVAGPQHGTLTLNPDGSFTYTPDANYNGPDAFTYKVNDGIGGTDTATVEITVTAENDPPVGVNDSYTTAEDTPLNIAAPGVLANDGDVDGDLLAALLVAGPQHGTLTLNPDGSFTYTPDANYNGPDAFTYKVNDGIGGTDTATVEITVTAENDPPVGVNDSYTTAEDTPLNIAAPGVLANDGDVDGNLLAALLVAGPQHGTLTLNPDGSFTYTPDANYNGPDAFTYKVNDGNGGTDTATVEITVTAENDPPVGVNDSYTTAEDTPLNIAAPGVLANDGDVDGDLLAALLVAGPQHGTLTLNPDGSFTYTPNANYNGPDAFTYKVSDGIGGTDTATVDITVTAENDPPVGVNDSYTTAEDTPLNIAAPGVLANDGDIDGNLLAALLVTGPQHGTLTLNPDGSFTYTPNANYNGPDAFTYKVSDGIGGTDTATVDITVTAENDPPIIEGPPSATVTIKENTKLVTTVRATDINSVTVTYSIVPGADSSLFTIDPNTGELSFITAPDYEHPMDADHNNSYVVQVQASDGTLVDLQTITINVENVSEDTQGPTGVDFKLDVSAIGNLQQGQGQGLNPGVSMGVFMAVGDPNSSSFTYQLIDTDDAHVINNFFSFNATNGALSTKAAVGAGTYTFDIIATDQDGNSTAPIHFAIIVDSNGGHTINTSSGSQNIVYGLNGDDVIVGGTGNDNLAGGQQNDTLSAGPGSDQLWGGPNGDTFLFTSLNDSNGSTSLDTILDFGEGADKIDLHLIDAKTGLSGDQDFGFVADQTSTVVPNKITWYQSGGNTIIQGDVNGDAVADLQIVLTGLHILSSGNFIL